MFLTFPPCFNHPKPSVPSQLGKCCSATVPCANMGPVGTVGEPGQPMALAMMYLCSLRSFFQSLSCSPRPCLKACKCYWWCCIYSVNQLSSYVCFCFCTNLVSLLICKKMTLLLAELSHLRDSLELEEGPHTISPSRRKAIFANAKQTVLSNPASNENLVPWLLWGIYGDRGWRSVVYLPSAA